MSSVGSAALPIAIDDDDDSDSAPVVDEESTAEDEEDDDVVQKIGEGTYQIVGIRYVSLSVVATWAACGMVYRMYQQWTNPWWYDFRST